MKEQSSCPNRLTEQWARQGEQHSICPKRLTEQWTGQGGPTEQLPLCIILGKEVVPSAVARQLPISRLRSTPVSSLACHPLRTCPNRYTRKRRTVLPGIHPSDVSRKRRNEVAHLVPVW